MTDAKSYPIRNSFMIEIEYRGDCSFFKEKAQEMIDNFEAKYGDRIGQKHTVSMLAEDQCEGTWSFGAYCKDHDDVDKVGTFAEESARNCGFKAGGKEP